MRGAWWVSLFRSFLAILAAALLTTAGARPGYADGPGFICPRDGLSVEGMWVDTQYKFVTWFDGADPKDPAMCYVRFMPLGPNGERIHMARLYNTFFRQTVYESHKLVNVDDLRRGMDALLTGQTDKATFTFGVSINGAPPVYSAQEWQRVGTETLTIGDRVINAVVFRTWSDREYWPGGLRSGRHTIMRRWFDPATSIFVKEVVEENVGGGPSTLNYIALRISDEKN